MHVGEEKLSWGNVLYSLLLKARCTQSSSMAQVMHEGELKRKLCVEGCMEQAKGCVRWR